MAVAQSPAKYADVSRAAIGSLDAELQPNQIRLELFPPANEERTRRLAGQWHRVDPTIGMKVRLVSTSEQVVVVRLNAESQSPGFSQHWTRWTYAVRRAPELLGGESVDAQDMLSDDRTELKLLLLPGEAREAVLEFSVSLDGETRPGHYLFHVRISDITSQDVCESCTLAGRLELVHPASRMLNLLPSAYRDACSASDAAPRDGQITSFFERFLRGFDDSHEQLNAVLDRIPDLFGPYSAPGDLLPWLSSWIGLVLDENWSEMKRRRLIAEAVELYRWRGTRRGLSRYLEIYAGVRPEIDDRPFRGMRLGPDTKLGINTVLGDIPDHTFVVTLAVPDPSAINERTVRDIIDAEKPAHTGYSLRIVRRETSEEERI